MSLLDLSWRNIKRNFRLYTIYFISMLVGVVIYFTFSALMFNEDVVNAIQNKENYQMMIFLASILVFLFIVFFILYANSFFMKQRKKEFGMFLLYGMKERQVATMVFFETVFLSAISVTSGILIGGLLSKFFGAVLMNLMRYDNDISFAFPMEAIVLTILLFAFLIGIITIQSYFSVRRVQLVELFHAKEKMDKPFQFSFGFAILSIILIASSYYMITLARDTDLWKDHFNEILIATTVALIIGTYLFFRQFSGWILQKMSLRKNYFTGNNMLWISSLRFSIRGNAVNFTFNSLLSGIVIFTVGFIAVDYAIKSEVVKMEYPNHFAFSKQNDETQKQIEQIMNDSHPIIGHETITGIQTEKIPNRNRFFNYPEYYTEEFYLFPESQLNAIVDLRGVGKKVDLKDNEAIVLTRGVDQPTKYNESKHQITVLENYTFRIVEKIRYPLLSIPTNPNGDTGIQPSVLIIPDEVFHNLKEDYSLLSFEIYKIKDPKTSNDVSREIYDIVMKTKGAYYSAYIDMYSRDTESSSLILFSVAFLAVIALFALGSIIYFKQLREATEQREHYAILRKMGVRNKEIKRIIRKQLLFVFLPPLILGLLHSWYFLYYTALAVIKELPSLTMIIFSVMGLYVLTYLIFYVSSTSIYFRIINEKNT
ncbi:ABC transporter permease [Neobacillus thermocopriae]|uniref:ABC transporter permease n=1 Tax=Neobacillus thermocopriae TaxID=1215031 RepID=A0A6B3TTU2_9BACI|nr:ABC transporter permease [Neobacillus thermocopriae]MED3624639.1 ABC transporter permease [Neobacillus thermocopriae]MED3715732.1 ABC transporter permease [Neobacillus thermocopriae]NEX79087.1 ABC transporter permease [Neobacillus thermocopriae]